MFLCKQCGLDRLECPRGHELCKEAHKQGFCTFACETAFNQLQVVKELAMKVEG